MLQHDNVIRHTENTGILPFVQKRLLAPEANFCRYSKAKKSIELIPFTKTFVLQHPHLHQVLERPIDSLSVCKQLAFWIPLSP